MRGGGSGKRVRSCASDASGYTTGLVVQPPDLLMFDTEGLVVELKDKEGGVGEGGRGGERRRGTSPAAVRCRVSRYGAVGPAAVCWRWRPRPL
jgi:hypothetical protein